MTISKEMLKGCERPEDLLGDAGLMKELKIRLMERMLGAELTAHLGYTTHLKSSNTRNVDAYRSIHQLDGTLWQVFQFLEAAD